MTFSNESVTTELADFPTLAWRTIPRRFSGEEKAGLLFNILTIEHYDRNRERLLRFDLKEKEEKTKTEIKTMSEHKTKTS